MSTKRIYLDHNATTPLHPEVKKEMCKAMDVFGNPSSLHSFGREARKMIESAREKVASFIGAETDEITFVASGSEANNTVLSIITCPSAHCLCGQTAHKNIVTSTIEHPCIMETSACLAQKGLEVNYVGVDKYGKIDMKALENKINEQTGIVSVMMANNEIGTLQDIGSISRLAHKKGAMFHTDAVQAVGKVSINVKKLDVDFLTISGHKLYGPKGIGALYIRKGTPFCPLIRGGHQEQGRRAGTENTIGIAGLAKAIEMRAREMSKEEKRLLKFKEMLKNGIVDKIPDIQFNGHPIESLASTLNVSFDGAEGESILLYLDLEGIAVSTGSACASGSLDPSHVLLACGLSAEKAHGSIRISTGRETKEEDIERVIDILPRVIKKIRKMSSAYREK
ncbi:MAG: IscS subfamily cysteine desulfurase [Candidatus Omnitrophica bacterium]|nr:IscS subfamily cysteine desulfurase [Candidatus Omnitrophota bacterium]